MSDIGKVKRHLHRDMMKPHGEVVTVFRSNISFEMKLNGIRSVEEECSSYAETNPGTVRIENSSGTTIWSLN